MSYPLYVLNYSKRNELSKSYNLLSSVPCDFKIYRRHRLMKFQSFRLERSNRNCLHFKRYLLILAPTFQLLVDSQSCYYYLCYFTTFCCLYDLFSEIVIFFYFKCCISRGLITLQFCIYAY